MASTSLTNTNISDTYVGVLHAKGEPIPASGLQDVYDGFGNKTSLKIGRAGQGIDVDGDIGVSFINAIYPINSVIFSVDDTDPGTRFPGTSWSRVAEGKFIAGVGEGEDKNGVEHTVDSGDDTTKGEYKVALTEAELPTHTHETVVDHKDYTGVLSPPGGQRVGSHKNASYAISIESSSTGGDQSHNNVPPAYGLYVWKRTA